MNLDGALCNVEVYQSPTTLLHAIDKSKTDTATLEAFLRRKNIDVESIYTMDQPMSLMSKLVAQPHTCRYSVQQNVERLCRLGGIQTIPDTLHVKKPLLLSRDGRTWVKGVHAHHVSDDRFGREGTHYKDGLTIVKTSSSVIINTFTMWDGEIWVSMAIMIDCRPDVWRVKDSVVNGFLNGLSRWPERFESELEHFVDEYTATFSGGYTLSRPEPGDKVYRTATDTCQRPVLIDMTSDAKYGFNHVALN